MWNNPKISIILNYAKQMHKIKIIPLSQDIDSKLLLSRKQFHALQTEKCTGVCSDSLDERIPVRWNFSVYKYHIENLASFKIFQLILITPYPPYLWFWKYVIFHRITKKGKNNTKENFPRGKSVENRKLELSFQGHCCNQG